jgi:hypothetical protein
MILAEGQLRITKDRIRKKKKDREGGEELEMGLARTQRWARPFFFKFLNYNQDESLLDTPKKTNAMPVPATA